MGFDIEAITSLDEEIPTDHLQPYVSVKRLTTQQRRRFPQPPPTTRCLVQFAPSAQGTAHILSIQGGSAALELFLSTEPHPPPPIPRSATYTARDTPIKRSSSAQAPTRTKRRSLSPASPPPEVIHPTLVLPTSPARRPRRPHTDLLHIVLEEGNLDRDSLPR